ncbi:hypothetical protein HOH51_00725 [bacterium]|jgi:hypothetical protein|nr:hypothetical protein [bacterium]
MKIHKFNKQLIFLEEILFTCMFAFGVIHITFGMLYIKTGQAGLKLMVEILDIPFFVSFVLYTITTIKLKTARNLAKPVYNWQNIVIIGASITILLLSLELLI